MTGAVTDHRDSHEHRTSATRAADHRLSQISTASSTNSKRARAHIGPWQLGRTLGRGSSGRVRLAKHTETGKLAAVKIVPKAQMLDHSVSSAKAAAESFGIEREVIIMKLIEHPNIMTLYDVWENKGELYLVLEYIEGGELFDYLICRGRLSEREAVHYFRQICYGVDYCHKFNICHRDLKPENLLLDKHRNIKIADFGMAALESNGRLLETSCGSPHYASPEIVTGKTYHGAPSDIWSCGIILFALLTGHLPFDDDNIRQLLLKVQAGKFVMPQSLSPEARDIILRMLVVDPRDRITMREIFVHPLLTKYPLRRVPAENSDKNSPKIDVTQPIGHIDPEILRNLQTLWHHNSRDSLVAKLRKTEPNPEKTFYSLLLRFRQRHGLASRESLPHNRSAASIRSLRSSKSVRSLASLNSKSGSVKSLRSVWSNRSGRSFLSGRTSRRSPIKHRSAASATATKTTTTSTNSVEAKPTETKNTDVFAQLLDQAFNPISKPNTTTTVTTATAPGHINLARHPMVTTARAPPVPSTVPSTGPNAVPSYQSQTQAYPPQAYPRQAFPRQITPGGSMQASGQATTPVKPSGKAPLGPVQGSQAPQLGPIHGPGYNRSEPKLMQADNSSGTSFDFSFPSTEPEKSNYLLPMIFEEDRFADAIEEEMDLKISTRGGRAQQVAPIQPMTAMASGNTATPPVTAATVPAFGLHNLQPRAAPQVPQAPQSKQPGDISQLRINNLVAGESFLSYQPSPAAAAIPAPVRPAPCAPKGPRTPSVRKPVPIYVESDSDTSTEDTSPRRETARAPLTPLTAENLMRQRSTATTGSKLVQPVAALPQPEQLTVPKRGHRSEVTESCTPSEEPKRKLSWIRKLTPRIVSRKSSKSETSRVEPTTEYRKPDYNNKENSFRDPLKPQPEVAQSFSSRTVSGEEPRQNWFMKLLSSVAQPPASRLLESPCQPIELRALILEVLHEWMAHGLALYNDGARGEPIDVAVLRHNSLHLKPARIRIAIRQRTTDSSARLMQENGSRATYFTFASELERRLTDNHVLSH